MDAPAIVDQQLVIHFYLPLDGPQAVNAYTGLHELWSGCRYVFGMTDPIPGTGLPSHLPDTIADIAGWSTAAAEESAIAAQERRGSGYQALLRRHHDVLNLSVALAPRVVDEGKAATIDATLPSEPRRWWGELDRRWRTVADRVSGEPLGEVRLYAALLSPSGGTDRMAASAPLGRRLRAFLSPAAEADDWWSLGSDTDVGFAVWETSPRDDARGLRRLVIAADEHRDAELSAWLWSRGDVAIPPLARYLLHAAKIRYQLRVWQQDRAIREPGTGVDAMVGELRHLLDSRTSPHRAGPIGDQEPADLVAATNGLSALRGEEVAAVLTGSALRQMCQTVEIATANMAAVPGIGDCRADGRGPFHDDRTLAEWFAAQLADDGSYLETTARRARQIGEISTDVITEARTAPMLPVQAGRPVAKSGASRPDLDRSRGVFVVHGRDGQVRDRMFDFLRSLDLRPLEWESLVAESGSAAPYLGDVVTRAVCLAQAAVVLLTPDDQVSLHPSLRSPADSGQESEPGMQARPNVLLEMGMALATYPKRTVLIQVGELRPIADLGGLNFIRLNDTSDCRRKIAVRLQQAGCPVNDQGSDWLAPGRFADLAAYLRR
jgi:predicted nucleotide-binding protein